MEVCDKPFALAGNWNGPKPIGEIFEIQALLLGLGDGFESGCKKMLDGKYGNVPAGGLYAALVTAGLIVALTCGVGVAVDAGGAGDGVGAEVAAEVGAEV
jgi:hypothetical protein